MRCRILVSFCLLLLAACASTPPPVQTAEMYFKEGEKYYASHNYEDAVAQWKKVKESYSSPELTTQAELKIADAYFENKSYIEAAAAYEDFRKLHPEHEKAAYALYRLGLCHYNDIDGIDRDQTPVKSARMKFEELLKQYPTSEYAGEAKDKLEVCKTNQARYEIYVGRFYLRTEKYESAVSRLENELQTYPDLAVNDEALFYLGQAYLELGNKAKGKDAFMRLSSTYPNSKYLDKAKKYLEKNY